MSISNTTISEKYIPTLKNAENSYQILKKEIDKLRWKQWLFISLKGLTLWLSSILILILLWFVFGGILHLPKLIRFIFVILFCLCGLYSAYFFFIRALIAKISVERMAFRVEQLYPQFQDRLIASMQLWNVLSENKYGYSENLIKMTIEEARAIFGEIDKRKVILNDLKRLKNSALIMFLCLIPIILVMIFFPSAFSHSLYAFANPLLDDNLINNAEISNVMPGNITVEPGSNVEIIAEIKGLLKEDVILNVNPQDGEQQRVILTQKNPSLTGNKSYYGNLNNIRRSLDYYISVGNVESAKYHIKVAEKPVIVNLQVDLYYPKYTGIGTQSLSPNYGDISAPVGTKAVIKADTNKDIASASIVFIYASSESEVKNKLDIYRSRTLNGSFIVKQSGSYYISIIDVDGLKNSDPVRYTINAIPDQPPKVRIIEPVMNITIGSDMKVPLQIETDDDHGITSLKLNYEIEGKKEKANIFLGNYDGRQNSITLKHIWDLTPIQLFPDDVVTYYIEATDNDNVSGPNIGRSQVYTARFPSLYEIYKEAELEQQKQESAMEDALNKQDDAKKAIDDIIKELKSKDQMDWSAKKELEKAVDLQKKIEEEVKSIAQQIEETTKKMEENPLISTELLNKVKEIKDLINEIATDEMKQLMRKLSEALNKSSALEQQKDLSLASIKQEEIMEKLDRIIDLFKNMKIGQKLEVISNQAKELIKQQSDTIDKTDQLIKSDKDDIKAKSNELSNRENRIKNQFDQLQKDIDNMADEAKTGISELIKQLSQRASQRKTTDKMSQASTELKSARPKESLPYQNDALSGLTEFQDDVQTALDMLKGQDTRETINALRDAIQKSLYASYRHEEITKSTSNIKGSGEAMLPKEKEIIDSLAVDQLSLSDSVAKIAKSLKDLSHKNPAITPELVWNLEKVANSMQRSAKAMEDKLPSVAEPIQRNSLSMINKAIEDMLDSIDKINSQAMPMASMDDFMEQLRQLADQQSQLNQATQEAEGQMRKQGTTPSLEDLLEKLAAEQSLIREASERLSEKLDQLKEKMGSLEEIAKEMQEVERTLKNGYVDRETIDRQKQILTRLLEYEKSMKTEDFDKKREAKVGRDLIANRPPTELPADANKVQKKLDTMFSPSIQEKIPLQYREQIKMYFKNLSNSLSK
ncbi:TPA: hypothetical protein ENX78_00710 [Candidatus Poribacteria bacterium]|nr:hypothetical protein [Candidatus Poribacteria bacterium]